MRALLISGLALALTTTLPAAATLNGANFGSYISGPQVDASQFSGQVVFWEYWGVNCPPCRASISHLVSLKEELGDQVLMVANHAQSSDPANIRKVWSENGGNDRITVIDRGGLPGHQGGGIPKCYVFDHTGELVFEGHPMQVDDALRQACAKAPGKLATGYDWQHLQQEARTIGRQEGPIGGAIKSVRKSAESDDAAVVAEATELLSRVNGWVAEERAAMEAARTADPLAAWTKANTMAGLLKGDDLEDQFKEVVKEMKKDRAFQNEVKAGMALAKIEDMAAQQGVVDGSADPSVVAACKKALESVIKKYDGTVAANAANGYLTEWKL